MKKYALFLGLLALVLLTSTSFGEIPKLLNYQGYLTDASGNPVADDNYSLTFRLYASEGADTNAFLWKETQTVSVSEGTFNAILGLTTSLNLGFAQPYWLGIKVGTNPELSPRVRLTSVGYAYRALRADTADYALSAPGGPSGNTWTFRITDTADTTITTGGCWGIARYGNTLYGNADSTHVNFGVACTTAQVGRTTNTAP